MSTALKRVPLPTPPRGAHWLHRLVSHVRVLGKPSVDPRKAGSGGVGGVRPGIGSHQSAKMGKDEWCSPPDIVRKLGPFDLDPCSPVNRPWPTARHHYTILDDGLSKRWFGRVWLNPPYGQHTGHWMERLADHGNGISLIFARTETEVWFRHIWPRADSILFLSGRLYFYHASGKRAEANAGAPSALIAYGSNNTESLMTCGFAGYLVRLGGGGGVLVGDDNAGIQSGANSGNAGDERQPPRHTRPIGGQR